MYRTMLCVSINQHATAEVSKFGGRRSTTISAAPLIFTGATTHQAPSKAVEASTKQGARQVPANGRRQAPSKAVEARLISQFDFSAMNICLMHI
jgi:hypothetical protein